MAAEVKEVERLSGPALNALVAEKVMGWSRGERYANGNGEWIIPGRESNFPFTWSQTPRFSESIEAAMQVVEKVNRRMEVDFFPGTELPWCVMFVNAAGEAAWAKSLPEAICLAALSALEAKEK